MSLAHRVASAADDHNGDLPAAADRGREPPERLFNEYPQYKDSGIEWLGGIPSHWAPTKVKYLGDYINGYPFEPADWGSDGLPIVRIQNLSDPTAPLNRFAGTLKPRHKITRGDVLISWSASLGLFVWESEEDAWLNQHIFKVDLHLDLATREFFIWLGQWFIRELRKEMHGSTMTHLTDETFGGFRVYLPPVPEQCAIAAFLDRETAKIDALVAKKERLIELLMEKRTALITRAVTKGLDQNAAMKDSGVEWLGKIPAHWGVRPWRYCCRVTEGLVAPDDDRYRERILIAPNHVEPATGRIVFTETADEQGAVSGKYLVRPGDLIYSKIRPSLNKVCIATGDWLCSADMYPIAITARDLESRYLLYFMLSESFVRSMVDESMRVAMPKVNRDKLAACRLVIPPLAEQRAIVSWLDRETALIDGLVALVRTGVDRLEEFRSALLSAVVTGKIDVHEIAAD